MAQTILISQRPGESWSELTTSFMEFCVAEKGATSGGCHEGENNPALIDGVQFASIAIPDHTADLAIHLTEWADAQGRAIRSPKQKAEQD